MISAVKPEDIPRRPPRQRTPGRLFADQSVKEFLASEECLVEVTGWPSDVSASHMASFLRAAAHQLDAGRKVIVFQRLGHVYLERR